MTRTARLLILAGLFLCIDALCWQWAHFDMVGQVAGRAAGSAYQPPTTADAILEGRLGLVFLATGVITAKRLRRRGMR